MGEAEGKKAGWFPGKLAGKVGETLKEKKEAFKEKRREEGDSPGPENAEGTSAVGEAVKETVKDSAAPLSGWTPGKFIKDAHGNKSMSQVESALVDPGWAKQSGRPVARVSVEVREWQGVDDAGTQLVVWVGGVQRTIGGNAKGLAPTTFEFEVPTLSTDIHLLLFSDKRLAREPIGRIAIPLAFIPLYPNTSPGSKATLDSWYQFYPMGSITKLKRDGGKFMAVIPGVPGTGLPRAGGPMGHVHVLVAMEMLVHVHEAYLGAALDVQVEAEPEEETGPDELPEIDPTRLQHNMARLKRAMGRPTLLQQPLCFVLYPTLAYACLFAPLWHVPLIGWGLVAANGIAARALPTTTYDYVMLWEDQVGDSVLPKNIKEKLGQLKKVVGGIQKLTGAVATGFEKSSNALTFADPYITTAILAMGGVGACAISLALAIFPANWIVFGMGTVLLLANDISQMDRPSEGGSKEEKGGSNGGLDVRKVLGELVGRVPDGPEMEHRHICRKAMKK